MFVFSDSKEGTKKNPPKSGRLAFIHGDLRHFDHECNTILALSEAGHVKGGAICCACGCNWLPMVNRQGKEVGVIARFALLLVLSAKKHGECVLIAFSWV